MALKSLFKATAALGGGVALAVEARYRRQPGNAVAYIDEAWGSERKAADHLHLGGRVRVRNLLPDREVMLCDVEPRVQLLSAGSLDGVRVEPRVLSEEPNYPPRADGYWTAFVVKPGRHHKDTAFEIVVDVRGPGQALDALYAAWIAVAVDTYGFDGPRLQVHHVVVPLRFPDTAVPDTALPDTAVPDSGRHESWRHEGWRDAADGEALVKPIRTHVLGPLDDPVEVVRRYALPHARPGDIVTIGESPLAVIQGRFVDPASLHPGWFATRSAQFMSGEGSLGTAGGMQALVNEVGVPRVAAALVGGVVGKLAGQPGWFYRLSGDSARLVDDVTGTLPPYDNFIVLGPDHADDVCAEILGATGLQAAVVDANDLGAVDVIGASPSVPHELVKAALRKNPAGNADETTPIVLIRPCQGER
jgi:hypothetical protein